MFARMSSFEIPRTFGIGGSAGPLAFFALAVAACGDDSTRAMPSLGAIEVRTITEGGELVPDSFEVQIHGAKSGNVGPNDIFYVENLPRGTHQIGLKESPAGCRFQANPRPVLVTPNDTAETTFLVDCR